MKKNPLIYCPQVSSLYDYLCLLVLRLDERREK